MDSTHRFVIGTSFLATLLAALILVGVVVQISSDKSSQRRELNYYLESAMQRASQYGARYDFAAARNVLRAASERIEGATASNDPLRLRLDEAFGQIHEAESDHQKQLEQAALEAAAIAAAEAHEKKAKEAEAPEAVQAAAMPAEEHKKRQRKLKQLLRHLDGPTGPRPSEMQVFASRAFKRRVGKRPVGVEVELNVQDDPGSTPRDPEWGGFFGMNETEIELDTDGYLEVVLFYPVPVTAEPQPDGETMMCDLAGVIRNRLHRHELDHSKLLNGLFVILVPDGAYCKIDF